MPSASATVVFGATLTTSRAITSRTFGDTSDTNFGAAIPNERSTKSIRSLVSPQRAATASTNPVRRLNSAYPIAEQIESVSGFRCPITKTSLIPYCPNKSDLVSSIRCSPPLLAERSRTIKRKCTLRQGTFRTARRLIRARPVYFIQHPLRMDIVLQLVQLGITNLLQPQSISNRTHQLNQSRNLMLSQ